MNRLTDRNKEIQLPCTGNGVFWARVHEKLARYEDTGLEPDELEKLVAFKEYFDALYGQGLQIANWHMNGDLEPFDSFYEEAIADNEEKDPDGKNDQMEP